MKRQNKDEWKKEDMSTRNANCIVQPCLSFNGRCEAALEFYRNSLGSASMVLRLQTHPNRRQVHATRSCAGRRGRSIPAIAFIHLLTGRNHNQYKTDQM